MEETAVTRWFEDFRSLAKFDWVPRLLSESEITALCPAVAQEVEGTTWRHLPLAMPALHPGVFPNGARPLEFFLAADERAVANLIWGPEDDTSPGLLVLSAGTSGLGEGAVIDKATASANEGTGLDARWGVGSIRARLQRLEPPESPDRFDLWSLFLEHDRRPENVCTTVTPVPPVPSEGPLHDAWRALFDRNGRADRLRTLNPPAMILENEARQLQRSFEEAFWATCDYLAAHG